MILCVNYCSQREFTMRVQCTNSSFGKKIEWREREGKRKKKKKRNEIERRNEREEKKKKE